jgi:hypothetical protein
MASLRKKPVVESHDAPPVSTAPVGPAKLPPVADDAPKPVEIENKSPVQEAAKSEIQKRLAEAIQAETLQREAITQQPPPQAAEPQQQTAEQIIASSGLPEQVQNWLRQYPEYVLDPVKNAHLQKMHVVAEYQAGEAFTAPYLERMDVLLGLKPEAQSNGKAGPIEIEKPMTAPRYEAPPPRQRAYSGPPVSAPPHREVPSMRTGQAPTRREPLTDDERQIARNTGISDEEYQRQKEKMQRLKREGVIQDGGR